MNNNRAYGSYDQFVFNRVEMFQKVVSMKSVMSTLLSFNNTAKTEIVNHSHMWMTN